MSADDDARGRPVEPAFVDAGLLEGLLGRVRSRSGRHMPEDLVRVASALALGGCARQAWDVMGEALERAALRDGDSANFSQAACLDLAECFVQSGGAADVSRLIQPYLDTIEAPVDGDLALRAVGVLAQLGDLDGARTHLRALPANITDGLRYEGAYWDDDVELVGGELPRGYLQGDEYLVLPLSKGGHLEKARTLLERIDEYRREWAYSRLSVNMRAEKGAENDIEKDAGSGTQNGAGSGTGSNTGSGAGNGIGSGAGSNTGSSAGSSAESEDERAYRLTLIERFILVSGLARKVMLTSLDWHPETSVEQLCSHYSVGGSLDPKGGAGFAADLQIMARTGRWSEIGFYPSPHNPIRLRECLEVAGVLKAAVLAGVRADVAVAFRYSTLPALIDLSQGSLIDLLYLPQMEECRAILDYRMPRWTDDPYVRVRDLALSGSWEWALEEARSGDDVAVLANVLVLGRTQLAPLAPYGGLNRARTYLSPEDWALVDRLHTARKAPTPAIPPPATSPSATLTEEQGRVCGFLACVSDDRNIQEVGSGMLARALAFAGEAPRALAVLRRVRTNGFVRYGEAYNFTLWTCRTARGLAFSGHHEQARELAWRAWERWVDGGVYGDDEEWKLDQYRDDVPEILAASGDLEGGMKLRRKFDTGEMEVGYHAGPRPYWHFSRYMADGGLLKEAWELFKGAEEEEGAGLAQAQTLLTAQRSHPGTVNEGYVEKMLACPLPADDKGRLETLRVRALVLARRGRADEALGLVGLDEKGLTDALRDRARPVDEVKFCLELLEALALSGDARVFGWAIAMHPGLFGSELGLDVARALRLARQRPVEELRLWPEAWKDTTGAGSYVHKHLSIWHALCLAASCGYPELADEIAEKHISCDGTIRVRVDGLEQRGEATDQYRRALGHLAGEEASLGRLDDAFRHAGMLLPVELGGLGPKIYAYDHALVLEPLVNAICLGRVTLRMA